MNTILGSHQIRLDLFFFFLETNTQDGDMQGFSLYKRSPKLTHLQFGDDNFLYQIHYRELQIGVSIWVSVLGLCRVKVGVFD